MTASKAALAAVPLEPVRLLQCILPDDGTDCILIQALRKEWNIDAADSIACRGVSMLRQAKAQKAGHLPESNFAKLVQIIAPESTVDALFEFVCATARIGRPKGGMVMLGQPIHATPFHLPEDLPDEAG